MSGDVVLYILGYALIITGGVLLMEDERFQRTKTYRIIHATFEAIKASMRWTYCTITAPVYGPGKHRKVAR